MRLEYRLRESHLLAESEMLLVVLKHLALVCTGGVVLGLLDGSSDLGHELLKIASSHVNGDIVFKKVTLEVGHARCIHEL